MLLSAMLSVVKHFLLNNTTTKWYFLIKASYLGKVRVMCDVESKGLAIYLAMIYRSYN